MRLKRLDLLRYGHFTDKSLELPAGKSDFHIVFGPNEAGKSTALSAIEDLLFGIPTTSRYGFKHDYGSMRIGAILENGADTLEVLRRKGNKDTLLGPEGSPLPGGDGVLRPYLAGADRTFFERMFSLDHKRLEAGGQAILEAKDDVGQMLFSAGAGIGGLREQLTQLTAEAEELWSARRAKHRKFYIAEDKFTEATKELRDQTLSATRWRELKKAYEEAAEAYTEIDEAFSAATTTRNQLSRIRRVFRDVRRKQELDELLSAIGEVVALPEEASNLVSEAESKDANINARIGTLEDQLKRAEEAFEKLACDETILQRAADVRQICERRIEIRREKADLPKREAELEAAADKELKSHAAELDWRDENPTVLIARIPSRPKISVVRSLLNHKGELESEVTTKAGLLEEAKEEQGNLKQDLSEFGEPADVSRLAITLKTVREQGDIAGRVRAAEKSLNDAKGQVQRRFGALDPAVDEAVLIEMSVPPRPKVQKQREAQDDWYRRLKETRQSAVSIQQDLDRAVAAREQVIRDEQVVTAEDLDYVRGRRNSVWQLVKLKHIEGQPIPTDQAEQYKAEIKDLAGAFEPAILRADELADRRFDHAEAAGRITEINRKIGELETLLGQMQDNETKLVEEGEQLKADWAALWAEVPFEPDTPEIMLDWLEDRETAIEAVEAQDEAERTLEAARGEEQVAKQQLLAELAALGIDIGGLEADGLSILVERAAEELRVRASEADNKKQLEEDIAEANKSTKRRQRDLEAAEETLGKWQDEWATALGNLGLAVDTPTEAVESQIDIIDQMRDTATRINSLRNDRIEKIKKDIADFNEVVAALVAIVAPDLKDKPSDDAVAELESRLNEAERVQDLREKQGGDIQGLKEQIEALEGQRRELVASISHLKQAAGVDDSDSLKAAIERSDNQRALRKNWQEIIEKLRQDGDGKSVEELEAECEGLEIDTVMAQEDSLEAELENLRNQLSAAGEVRVKARQEFQAIGGDDAAAQAATAKEEALTEMSEVAERYTRVRTSVLLLQWAIDRYRREKQAPLVNRAGELFQIMTGGSFASLRVDFDDQDNAKLNGVRADESVLPVPVSGMSTGTADQLFLALRVGAIEDYLQRADALPFVADDLFINFDDERAAAGFKILGQLAEKTQVLFFTHHQHLLDIARETMGTSVNTVSLNEQSASVAAL